MLNGQMIAVCWLHWSPGQEVRLVDSQVLLQHMQMYLLIHPHKRKTGTIWKHSQHHGCYCLQQKTVISYFCSALFSASSSMFSINSGILCQLMRWVFERDVEIPKLQVKLLKPIMKLCNAQKCWPPGKIKTFKHISVLLMNWLSLSFDSPLHWNSLLNTLEPTSQYFSERIIINFSQLHNFRALWNTTSVGFFMQQCPSVILNSCVYGNIFLLPYISYIYHHLWNFLK